MKFENALREVVTDGMKGPAILQAVKARREHFKVTADEMNDLIWRSSNYFERAKNAKVIRGNGPHQGYSLIAPATQQSPGPGQQSGGGPTTPVSPPATTQESAGRQQREALLHFSATIALSFHAEALVHSLKKVNDNLAWGNPDMLFVRDNSLSRLFSALKNVDATAFAPVQAIPQWVLASLELKFGLGGDRRLLLQAVSECATNSRWANESWLVLADGSTTPGIEEAVARHARDLGVGLMRVVAEPELGVDVLVSAPTRASLDFGDEVNRRGALVAEAESVLNHFGDRGCFKDCDGDVAILSDLIKLAIENLRQQVGFGTTDAAKASLAALRSDAACMLVLRAAIERISAKLGDVSWPKGNEVVTKLESALTVADAKIVMRYWDLLCTTANPMQATI